MDTPTQTPSTTPLPTPHHLRGETHNNSRRRKSQPYNPYVATTGSNTERSLFSRNSSMDRAPLSPPPVVAASSEGVPPEWANFDSTGLPVCSKCGEQSVQVSERERTSMDGTSRHRHVTYVHSCTGSTPSHTHARTQDREAQLKTMDNGADTVLRESVVRKCGNVYTPRGKEGEEDARRQPPMATSTPSRFRERPRSVHTQTTLEERAGATGGVERGIKDAPRDTMRDVGPSRSKETRFRRGSSTTSPTHRIYTDHAPIRPEYTDHGISHSTRKSSSSSTHSSPQYRPSPGAVTSSSSNASPVHSHMYTDPYIRRGSTPAYTVSAHSTPTHVHRHTGLHHHTPSLDRDGKVHFPLSASGKPRYAVRYSHTDQRYDAKRRTRSSKPRTRHSSEEYSPEYYHTSHHPHTPSHPHHSHTPQHRGKGGQRSKLRRKLVHVMAPSDEVYYSEPSVRSGRVRGERKRRYEESDGVRGVYVKQRPVYVVEGEEYSSDSGEDVELDGLELEEILELAAQLKRRSRRMKSSLQAELGNRGYQ